VARNAKVLIAAAVVILLSLLLVDSDLLLTGAGVFVIGMLGVAVLYERDQEGDESEAGKDKLDRALEEHSAQPVDSSPVITPTPPASPAGGGLPTWTPSARGATSFDLPTEPLTPRPAPAPETPAAPADSGPASWHSWEQVDRGPVRDEYDPENPLAALDRLDEIDPIAEVERIESRAGESSSAFSFSSAPSPINEAAVRTDDDIMAASQATELTVSDGEDSELARLLAKVQQRLAAYE
jgi:hypothetical protein